MIKSDFITKPKKDPYPERDRFNYSSHIPEKRSGQEQRILARRQHAAHFSYVKLDWLTEKETLPLWPDDDYDVFMDEGTTIKASTVASNDDWMI